MAAPPPPYEPNGNRDPSQQAPATNLPNQPGNPIAMQPMGQPAMDTSGQKVTPLHLLTAQPQWVDCQMCQQRTRTRVHKEGEGMQFLTGALLCLVCICLAPLPCCLHWFEQTNWFCEKCGQMIATQTPETPVQVLPPKHAMHVPSQYAQQPPAPHMNPQSPPPGPQSPHEAHSSPAPGQQFQQPQSPPLGHPQSPPPMGYPQSPPPMGHPQSPPPEGAQYQQPYHGSQTYPAGPHGGPQGAPGAVPIEHQQHMSPEIAPATQASPFEGMPPKN